ncbi:hypothetical protein BDF19DRAFT_385180 [Syncephalis fuscata]|nr:hypothetical protein BDF19DRAFT_385180 [Syncephalis fuscata]
MEHSTPVEPTSHEVKTDSIQPAPEVLCRWTNCGTTFGDLQDLVEHLSIEHIGRKRHNYACYWEGCSRKGTMQTSRFALISHMRGHTGEKPFHCPVPECDKSFSRSDALTKHLKCQHANAPEARDVTFGPNGTTTAKPKPVIHPKPVILEGRALIEALVSSGDESEPSSNTNALHDSDDDDLNSLPITERYEHLKDRFHFVKRQHSEFADEHDKARLKIRRLLLERDVLLSSFMQRVRRRQRTTTVPQDNA